MNLVELRELIESRVSGDAPGLAVVVIDTGRVAFENTRGLANLGSKTPITPQTQFYLASVSKPFTAIAITILVEQGLLKYEAPLEGILSDLPPHLRKITIDQLLHHTSGLGNYLAESSHPKTNDQVLQSLRESKELLFPPGTKFRYSNTGYNLLATCVQIVSRETFPDFMKKEIFTPQQMTNTLVCTSLGELAATRAVGYRKRGSSFLTFDYDLETYGDGGIFSNLEDMIKWCLALESFAILKPAVQNQLFIPRALPGGEVPDYGRGWAIEETEVGKRIEHDGSLAGFRSLVAWYPNRKIWLILFANRDDLRLDVVSREIYKTYVAEKQARLVDAAEQDLPIGSNLDDKVRLDVRKIKE